ncbi:MAG: rod shape-determining protein [Planctomycetota bacterium]
MIQKPDQDFATAPSDVAQRAHAVTQEQGVCYIGIDLGTSRCAISSSNGSRESVGSVVGWPRDTVSHKMFGDQPLFGDSALEHRLSLDVVYPLADGNLRFPGLGGSDRDDARKAASELLKHLIDLARPRTDQLRYAVIGAPSKATKENKQAIIDVAQETGLDGVMVVSEPFSVAYGIEALDDAIVIDIGAGTIDLCRLHGTLPEDDDEITLHKAGNHVDAELARLIEVKYPHAQFNLNMIKKAKERFSGAIEAASDRAVVRFPVNGKPTDLDITDQMQQAVGMIIPEILQAIQTLVSSFDPEFQHRIRSNVVVSGGGSQIYGLRKALETGMQEIGGGNVVIVEEPVFAGANGALKLAREMPQRYWEKLR